MRSHEKRRYEDVIKRLEDERDRLRSAAYALVEDVAKKHQIKKSKDFKCPLMKALADALGDMSWAPLDRKDE